MKYFSVLIFLLIFTIYGNGIKNFSVVYESSICKIEWDSTNESTTRNYIVQKSGDGEYFTDFSEKSPSGNNYHYLILDNNPYRKGTIYYRLKVVDKDGNDSFSKSIAIKINTSSINATWGSIKAMFR